jgi:hypothetical protein
MTTFDEREVGFERKFVHDADTEFAIVARGNKLLGQWAAGKLGLNTDAADDYARTVVHAEFEKAGHDGVFEKVRADLAARDRPVTDDELRAAIAATTAEARHQIMDGA